MTQGVRPTSMVMTRIGGQDYPLRSVSTCRTCQSPHRLMIENELLKARSYAAIARSLEGMESGDLEHPTREGIGEHVKNGHMPIGPGVQRRIIERRAVEIGKNIEDSVDPLADYVTVNQMIVQKGFERLQAGDIDVDAKDIVAASKFLLSVDQSGQEGVDEQSWSDALMVYLELAVRFIPPEHQREYSDLLNANPILKAIVAKQEAKALIGYTDEDDDILDVEEVPS
jgi:hypothetical protein